jgi:predicted nucleotidyltransferase
MKEFNYKEEVFKYILENYAQSAKAVLVRGSTASYRVKPFSDFDIEIYSQKKQYPIYEIHLCAGYPILITIYFYEYKFGSLLIKPQNVKMLKGNYTSGIEEVFQKEINTKDPYNEKEKIIRNNQILVDFLFKFFRTKDENALNKVQKRLDFKNIPKEQEKNNSDNSNNS